MHRSILTALAALVPFVPAAMSAPPPAAPVSDVPHASGDVDWPMFNQTYDSQRYSQLQQITAQNASDLKEVCRVRVGDLGGFNGALIVTGGVMYMTAGNATVAINPADCNIIWKALYVSDNRTVLGSATRGPAVADGRVFRGTGDGLVIALDARSGKELWRTKIADPPQGESVSAAPLVWDGKVLVGIAGSELGIHGRFLALDAKTGAIQWQFNTVPQGTEPGVETWKGDSWKTGGGGTWSTTSLDPDTGEVFVPVGNPAPDFRLDDRFVNHNTGANLFTNSVVALNARDGKLSWYFQSTPADDHDLDQASPPMLLTLPDGRSALAAASKDGYLRVIDRQTHKLIYKVALTTIRNEGKRVTPKGIVACPGSLGGTQWNGPAHDAGEKAIVTGAVDWCSLLQLDPSAPYKPGTPYYGGRITSLMDPTPTGWLTSVDSQTGTVRWKFHAPGPIVSGVTPTAGGVTFFGDLLGTFYAMDSHDGKVLFSMPTGGGITGGVVTYSSGGKQFVAVTSGNLSRTMWMGSGLPTVVVYALGGTGAAAEATAQSTEVRVTLGASYFVRTCAACHGFGGGGGTGPSLKSISKRLDETELAQQLRHPRPTGKGPATMPPFDESVLSEQELHDVVAFLKSL